jgi:hypothetical protein
VLGQDFNFLVQRGADAAALAKIERVKGHSVGGTEIQYRRKGGSDCGAVIAECGTHDGAEY